MTLERIHLASTQGFCAGVASAIDVVDLALEKYGTPLYVRHHIVHNTTVINDFEAKGVVFIEEMSEVPRGQTVIFSAHGTAPDEYERAKERDIKVIDATKQDIAIHSNQDELKLITCYPFDALVARGPLRLVVTAKMI